MLTWLEVNCREAVARVNKKDPFIAEMAAKYVGIYMYVHVYDVYSYTDVIGQHNSNLPLRVAKRYAGVPRNIYRHVLISDLDHVLTALPPVR